MANVYSIWLVGLERPEHELASRILSAAGHRVVSAPSIAEISANPSGLAADVVYLQPTAPDRASVELRRLRDLRAELPVVLVCPRQSADAALEAWHCGAADVLFPPLDKAMLHASLGRAEMQLGRSPNAEAERPQARFRYLDSSGKEQWAAVMPPQFTIGRSSTNDLCLSEISISRMHASVVLEDGDFVLQDVGSRHGTFVNGVRVDRPRKLKSGDRVQLGGLQGTTLTFHKGDLLHTLLGISDSTMSLGVSARGFKEIASLLATFRALSSIPLLDDLLALVVDTAIELTGAERGFIMLKDDAGGLTFRCARNSYKRPLDGSSFHTSHRVPDEVFKTGKTSVINDLDLGGDLEDHSSTRRLGVRSIFCVPLHYLAFHESGSMSSIGRMETIGVLYVDSQTTGAGLSGTQLDALETLASEAAMAIYNARLYKDSQEKRKLDEELAIAREIQQALLPNPNKALPYVVACSQTLPCREIGGDYFDYFDLEGGKLGFAVGDVAGKGMPAALLASMLQGIFSAETLLDLPLPAMISNVNRSLVRRATGNRFVTFFFGVLDQTGTCTYVNAGHNPPLLLRKDGSSCELTEGGMVLGLFSAAQYNSGTVQFEPGDHLVLFTDGVVEARDRSGEEFGEERLRALLRDSSRCPASEILACLQQALVAFSANTPQHDDITTMVLGYREAPTAI
jgi:phosphoserine phosphatase RsbU/P